MDLSVVLLHFWEPFNYRFDDDNNDNDEDNIDDINDNNFDDNDMNNDNRFRRWSLSLRASVKENI